MQINKTKARLAELTVTTDDKARVYGDANPAPTYQQTGLINGDTLAALATYDLRYTGGTLTITAPILFSISPTFVADGSGSQPCGANDNGDVVDPPNGIPGSGSFTCEDDPGCNSLIGNTER